MVKDFCCHIVRVVYGQQPHDVLLPRLADMEAAVPDALFQPGDLTADIVFSLPVQLKDQRKLPCRGGGGLDIVQMSGVLPQQFPQGRQVLLRAAQNPDAY